jgi:oligopeptide transport system permease protein
MLKKILAGIITLWIVLTLTFFILRWIPGGPFDAEKALPPEVKQNIEALYGLNLPVHIQYINYLKSLFKGDLGPSLKFRDLRVNDIISQAFPVSAKIGMIAFFLSLFLGIVLGLVEGMGKRISKSISSLFSVLISFPSFGWASILLFLLSYKIGIFPPALLENFSHYFLPVLTLSIIPTAHIGMLVGARTREEMEKGYFTFHRSLGFSEKKIYGKFLLKNVLSPVISSIGPMFAYLITGSFIVEKIFAIPGLGKFFVTSVIDRDYTTVVGLTVLFCAILIAVNIITEWLLRAIDPREKK